MTCMARKTRTEQTKQQTHDEAPAAQRHAWSRLWQLLLRSPTADAQQTAADCPPQRPDGADPNDDSGNGDDDDEPEVAS